MSTLPETIVKRTRWSWLFILLTSAFLLRCPVFIHHFFNGDEATYNAIANAILNGNVLYSSVVDHKPPMIYFTYALILRFSCRYCIEIVQFVSILSIVFTALMLGGISRSAGRSLLEQRMTGLCYVVFSAMGPGKDMLAANAEIFMMLPTVAAAWLFVHKRTFISLSAAGFLCAIAFLYKYQGGAILAALMFTLAMDNNQSLATRGTHLLSLTIGFLLPLCTLCLLYLLQSRIDSLYFWGWQFPLLYAGLLPGSHMAYNGLTMSLKWGLPNCVLLFASFSGFRSLKNDPKAGRYYSLLGFWLLWSILAVASGGRFYLHYYIQLLPVLSLLAAVGFGQDSLLSAASLQKDKKGGILPVIPVVLILLPLCLFWTANIFDLQLRPQLANYTGVYKDVGNWLKKNSNRRDTLLVWGNSPEIYYFSQRQMGTRFVFCNYLSGKIWGTIYDQEGAENTEKMIVEPAWDMLLDDIRDRKPQWIVDAAAGGLDRWQGHEMPRYRRLWQSINSRYRAVAEVDGTIIYRLLAEQPAIKTI